MGAKIVHFGSLGGPWHLEKPNPGKVQKKSSKRRPPAISVPPFKEPFWEHFSMIFESIFGYVFWIIFGAFWRNRLKSSKNRAFLGLIKGLIGNEGTKSHRRR